MIIIVSGHRRSGTSCMTRALLNGLGSGTGWGLLTQPHQEELNQEVDGYRPNPGPLYEVGRMYYTSAKFLRMMPDKSLVKIFWDGLTNIPSGEYVIVFMERDEEEINQSIARSDAHLRSVGVPENKPTPFTFDVFRPYNRDDIEHVKGIMRERRDVTLIDINYRDLIEDPRKTLESIKYSVLGKERVPIDIEKAAAVIKPEFYRIRKE